MVRTHSQRLVSRAFALHSDQHKFTLHTYKPYGELELRSKKRSKSNPKAHKIPGSLLPRLLTKSGLLKPMTRYHLFTSFFFFFPPPTPDSPSSTHDMIHDRGKDTGDDDRRRRKVGISGYWSGRR